MSSIDVDEIIKRLSTKFNRIFCDREFVCCVNEDFQVILKNKNKCCVVVFPVLGPNYLKAVRYQAKIFDLSVFTLGSEQICSIAVCHKEYLIKKIEESEEQIMPQREQDIGGSKLRKKRPERPLYVPPAQRKLPAHETTVQNNFKPDSYNNSKIKKSVTTIRKDNTHKTKVEILNKNENEDFRNISDEHFETKFDENIFDEMTIIDFIQWKYELSETTVDPVHVIKNNFRHYKKTCNFFGCLKQSKVLYFLKNNYYLWQPAMKIKLSGYETCANIKVIPSIHLENYDDQCNNNGKKVSILVEPIFQQIYEVMLKDVDVICDYNVLYIKNGNSSVETLFFCGKCYYLINNNCNDDLMEDIHNYLEREDGPVQIPEIQREQRTDTISSVPDNTTPVTETVMNTMFISSVKDEKKTYELEKSNSDNTSYTEQLIESDKSLQKNNIKNSFTNENVKNANELDEEKEIMRKAKENINRKTRPIMKYVEANNTLKIDKNENVNHWEDLFDEQGQLQEDLLKEIVHKVGNDVTIVKAKEDYSEYFTKQIEELEHMVELFDFPSSFETHDLIQAFSDIKSDAMYVKWVDDTHAILVLGSLSQAQKAIAMGHPLISVRPMTAASRVSLDTAYKHDLRPAMKRPQTNLQTARRLITSHLGTKTNISKERSAKERDDLRAAKEMKKLVRKNEQDAWEGNLRSSKTK